MTAWSWCLTERQNVQAGSDRRCPSDGSLVIAPTWGNSRQRFMDGAWSPEIERPEGHQWKPPAVPEPSKPKNVAARDTTTVLGPRTPTERKRDSRAKAVKVTQRTITARPCEHCRVSFFPRPNLRGGPLQRFCADACRKAAERARSGSKPRAPMSASGRVCAVCLRDDRPHKGGGLCRTCWNAASRERRSQEAADRPGPVETPVTCGHPERRHRANGLCASCYVAARRREGTAA